MDTASLSRDMGRYSFPLHHAGQIISLHGGIIRHAMKKSINEVVRGFWQGAKKIARTTSSSDTSEFNSDQINEDYIKADPIFTE